MRLIVTSRKEECSQNMYKLFIKEFSFKPTGEIFDGAEVYERGPYRLINVHASVLELEWLQKHFKPEVYLIASPHESAAQEHTLCCHATGNWGDETKFGGKPREICASPPFYLRAALLEMLKHAPEGYKVCFEATHHGPSEMNAPLCFIEVGSTTTEWNDLDACRAVCHAILADPEPEHKKEHKKVATAFGGTHYAPTFSKPKILEKYAINHICPKWYLDKIDEDLVKQAVHKSVPRADLVLIDKKGMSAGQREKLITILDKLGIAWEKV